MAALLLTVFDDFTLRVLLLCYFGLCLIVIQNKVLLQGSYIKLIFILLFVGTFPFELFFFFSFLCVGWSGGTKAIIISTPKNVKYIT